VKEAVRFLIVLVLLLIAVLFIFLVTGVQNIRVGYFEPFLPHGLNSLFSTAGFIIVSFGGVLTTASIAGEIKNPARNIPLGLIAPTITVTLVYAVVIFVVTGVVSAGELA